MMRLNEAKGAMTSSSYQRAGSLAYAAVSAIRTVLSSNGVMQMVDSYADATSEAFRESVKFTLKLGFATGTQSEKIWIYLNFGREWHSPNATSFIFVFPLIGSMMGSFLLLYCVLTLYGTSLLYNDVRSSGCDPSAGVPGAQDCSNTGTSVFGAMLGVAFAARGLSQVGNVLEVFSQARVAAQEALLAMRRVPGSPKRVLYKDENEAAEQDSTDGATALIQPNSMDIETGEGRFIKAILPAFTIDSATPSGLKTEILGGIRFQNVSFHYPTRPTESVLEKLSFEVAAGETMALVGTC
jgi:ABC-type multidrug transport system fused ATPase/permease subunit